jgi:glyoxylase-like metal-dependent hydrolase (beta-lactamase superfamily II)
VIIESKGQIHDNLYAIGSSEFPGYLLKGKRPVLFDAGMTFMGPLYLVELENLLGDINSLAFHFLTHSHFDHAGASPFLKRSISGLKIGASPAAAETFRKPNAIELIKNLSRSLEEKNSALIGGADVTFNGLEIDLVLSDGMEIELADGLVCRVIATPGHTRDSLSFYIPKMKAIITGEAIGAFDRNFTIHPEFTSSYQDYMASLEKLAALDIEIILMCHYFTLTGADARGYMQKAIMGAQAFKERIEHYLMNANGDRQAVVKKIFQEDYEATGAILQDSRPYLINLDAKVRVVAEVR